MNRMNNIHSNRKELKLYPFVNNSNCGVLVGFCQFTAIETNWNFIQSWICQGFKNIEPVIEILAHIFITFVYILCASHFRKQLPICSKTIQALHSFSRQIPRVYSKWFRIFTTIEEERWRKRHINIWFASIQFHFYLQTHESSVKIHGNNEQNIKFWWSWTLMNTAARVFIYLSNDLIHLRNGIISLMLTGFEKDSDSNADLLEYT